MHFIPRVLCPLLLCAGAAMPPATWAKPDTVTVIMVDNSFQPDHIVFHANHATALRLINSGKDMHEFTAPDFLKSAIVKDPHQLSNGGKDIVVQPGHTAIILLIPKRKGGFNLTCADHDWDGMTGHIEVE